MQRFKLTRTVTRVDWSKDYHDGKRWVHPVPSQTWPAVIAIGSRECIYQLAKAYGYTGPRLKMHSEGTEDAWSAPAFTESGQPYPPPVGTPYPEEPTYHVSYDIFEFWEGSTQPSDTSEPYHYFTNYNQKLEWEAYHQGDAR